jgi:hypothetical protein
MKRLYQAVRQLLFQKTHLVFLFVAVLYSIRFLWLIPDSMVMTPEGLSPASLTRSASFLPPANSVTNSDINDNKQDAQQPQSEPANIHKAAQEEPYFRELEGAESTMPMAIFYNAYIPTHMGQEGIDNALNIMKEQMRQVQRSDAAHWDNRTITMYYNSVGQDGILTEEYMQNNICNVDTSIVGETNKDREARESVDEQDQEPPHLHTPRSITCKRMAHYDEAHEHVTLQRLHEYCQVNPTHTVIYLHPKGTFHKYEDGKNDRWRQRLTSASTHHLCLNPPDDTCNVCSLHFYPVWAPFMPGNMWSAKCEYIQKLREPLHFDKDMDMIAKQSIQMGQERKIGFHMYNINDEDKLCRGRYSAECWIGSHPDLVPCELSDTSNLIVWMMKGRDHEPFQFSMGPRTPIHGPYFQLNTTIKKQVLRDEVIRKREFFLLPGNILKWYTLYNEVPPPTSWVWKWYPDGAYWQDGISKYGSRVVDIMTRPSKAR